jgi:glycosyltransferase involved in cell wall biosynthesis
MNILVVNHYAGSPRHGMEYRVYYLAREWVREGHRVQIVAASWSHARSWQPQVAAEPVDEQIDGIDYRWLPTPPYRGNGLGRVRNIWAFLRRLRRGASALVERVRPDVVIASSTYPFDVWVARRMARLAKAKLVYEVHDLWPASPIELGGMSPRHPFIVLCQKAENDAYRDADRVVSMLPKVAEHMSAHGLDLRKLVVIPNGMVLEEWDGEPTPLPVELANAMAKARSADRTIVGYAGSHGRPNALEFLLSAAALLRDAPVDFFLIGDGHEKRALMERAAAEGLDNVHFFAPIAKTSIPSLLRSIDIAYIGWRRVPIYRFGIGPNKLLDYMMAGCAVLHSVEAGNDPVAEAGCGLTVAPESPEAIAGGVRELAAMSPEKRAGLGARGRAFVLDRHAYPVLARHFIEAVSRVVPSPAHASATP